MAVALEDKPKPEWTGYLRTRAVMDDAATTIHALALAQSGVAPRIQRLEPPEPLQSWCARNGVANAISGGFYKKPELLPLGEHRIQGRPIPNEPFKPPWRDQRPGLVLSAGLPTLAPRGEITLDREDLLQAGPLLVRDGRPVVATDAEDPEGFSTEADLFDQDFTKGRLPRAGIALARSRILAVAVDGRAPDDAGLTLGEFARVLVELGAEVAMNLDGGASAALIADAERRNKPRDDDGDVLEPGQPVPIAILLPPRG